MDMTPWGRGFDTSLHYFAGAVDEIVSVGANAELGRGAALPRRTPDAYLPPETPSSAGGAWAFSRGG